MCHAKHCAQSLLSLGRAALLCAALVSVNNLRDLIAAEQVKASTDLEGRKAGRKKRSLTSDPSPPARRPPVEGLEEADERAVAAYNSITQGHNSIQKTKKS